MEEMIRNLPTVVAVCCLKQFRAIATSISLEHNDPEKSQGLIEIENLKYYSSTTNEFISMQNILELVSASCAEELGLAEEIEEFPDILAAPVLQQAELNFME